MNSTIPNQARLIFSRLKSQMSGTVENESFLPDCVRMAASPETYQVPGVFWDSTQDTVELTVLPGSVFDDNDKTPDSILFKAAGDPSTYEARQFRSMTRSGLGPIEYSLGPYGEKRQRGKS